MAAFTSAPSISGIPSSVKPAAQRLSVRPNPPAVSPFIPRDTVASASTWDSGLFCLLRDHVLKSLHIIHRRFGVCHADNRGEATAAEAFAQSECPLCRSVPDHGKCTWTSHQSWSHHHALVRVYHLAHKYHHPQFHADAQQSSAPSQSHICFPFFFSSPGRSPGRLNYRSYFQPPYFYYFPMKQRSGHYRLSFLLDALFLFLIITAYSCAFILC